MSPWWVGDGDPADAGFGDPMPDAAQLAEATRRARLYAQRFGRLAESGGDIHPEADLVEKLVAVRGSILDAGCGTGRVAARLAEVGYLTVGVDQDAGTLAEARRSFPALTWIESDLASLPTELRDGHFDAVVAAGDVMILLQDGTEADVIAGLAQALHPTGLLIAGFGLDDAHLPAHALRTARFRSLEEYDTACAAAGFQVRQRWSGWNETAFASPEDGYAVSVHQLRPTGN